MTATDTRLRGDSVIATQSVAKGKQSRRPAGSSEAPGLPRPLRYALGPRNDGVLQRFCRDRRVAVGIGALALAACSGTPETHFYTLLRPPAEATDGTAKPAVYAIEVLPVSVPEQVDMPQIVLRQGDGELALVESRQWAAPLGQELRLGLSEQLMRQLGVRDLYRLGDSAQVPLRRIKVHVTRFDSVLGRYARLEAGWNVRDDRRGLSMTCSTQAQERVGPSYDDLVLGHQRALARLAGEIALAVRAFDAGDKSECPHLPVPGDPAGASPPQPAEGASPSR